MKSCHMNESAVPKAKYKNTVKPTTKDVYNAILQKAKQRLMPHKNQNHFKTMLNKEIDVLHAGIESPIQRIPNKPCLPKVKIKSGKAFNKKCYLNKPYNRQAVVSFQMNSANNYSSHIKSYSKSYMTNFSSAYSPGTDNGSSSVLTREEKSGKKPTYTFLETNACLSMLSTHDIARRNRAKGESTTTLLRSKLASKTVIKQSKSKEKDYMPKATKAKYQK